MSKASKEELSELEQIIDAAADGLPRVTAKRMFGCHALFANDAVFGLVWKEGRIGVRLPDIGPYDKLMDLDGADPWKAGPMVMSHWVLVPESMHKGKSKLASWVAIAHDLALKTAKEGPAKKTKAKAKSPAKAKAKTKAKAVKVTAKKAKTGSKKKAKAKKAK